MKKALDINEALEDLSYIMNDFGQGPNSATAEPSSAL